MTIAPEHRLDCHVAHLTTVHKPFDVRIFHKQCKSLAAAGYRVSLVQSDCDAAEVDGVTIVPIRRARNRMTRMTLGVWQAVRATRRIGADIVHIHDVELIWGAALLKLLGLKVIYDVHEDVAKDLEDKAYLPAWSRWSIRQAVRLTEWFACKCFDRISAATSAIAARFPTNLVTLVRNTPILGEMSHGEAASFLNRPMHAVYLGGLAAFNGPVAMVDAVGQIPKRLNARLLLGGAWSDPKIEAQTRALSGWSRVNFLGWVARDEVADIFAQARCGLVLYQPTPNVIDSEPNKFFECLSAGLPIVASNFPVWQALVDRLQCGVCVDPHDHAAIANAITWMLDHPEEAQAMGERGRQAVLGGYNWSIDADVLVQLYDGLVYGSDDGRQHA